MLFSSHYPHIGYVLVWRDIKCQCVKWKRKQELPIVPGYILPLLSLAKHTENWNGASLGLSNVSVWFMCLHVTPRYNRYRYAKWPKSYMSKGYLRLKSREDKWVRRAMALGVWPCCVYVFMSPGSVPTDRMRPLSRHARYCNLRDCCCVLSLSWRAPLLCSHQHLFRSHIHHLGTPVTRQH